MKKLFAFVTVLGMLCFGASINALAQDEPVDTTAVEQVADSAATETPAAVEEAGVTVEDEDYTEEFRASPDEDGLRCNNTVYMGVRREGAGA